MKPFAGSAQSFERHEVVAQLSQFMKVLDAHPDDVYALSNAGHCFNVIGKDEVALEYFKAAAKFPHPNMWINYGAILRQCGNYHEAQTYIWNAHRNFPDDPRMGHMWGEELIRAGKWLKAWPLCSKHRPSKALVRPEGIPEWEGQSIEGKHIAVIGEGGFGDSFWLFRFLPKLRELGATYEFHAFEGIARFFEGHEYLCEIEPGAPIDYWVSLFELLLNLKVEKAYWPGVYIFPQLRPRLLKARKRVGICWDCGEADDVRKYRSLTLAQTSRLLGHDNVDWVSLQYDNPAFGDICERPSLATWQHTANAIGSLDLVISVDTAVCHLAGAMGIPTWLVLGGMQDCKWMYGDTTEWYPTFRIFRNDGFEFQFKSVLDKVEAALEQI